VEVVRTFDKPYKMVGKHRHKCRICGKLISDGEMTTFQLVKQEKFYPVKGIMRFNKWFYYHKDCRKGK